MNQKAPTSTSASTPSVAPFQSLRSRVVPLMADDVDTDQIIPARFLKVVDKEGLAAGLFAEWRKDPEFVLNRPASQGAEVLLAGRNFGCGSSREHAPWALRAGGFRAVIALSFADIFRANALKNGLLPVALDKAAHAALSEAVLADVNLRVEIDLEANEARWGAQVARFSIDEFARHCMLRGIDELGFLLAYADRIAAYEERAQRAELGA